MGFYPLDGNGQAILFILSIMVFFMQAGFCLLESALSPRRHEMNIIMKNVLDMSIASIGYWAVGFALAFGDGNAFAGVRYFALQDLPGPLYYAAFFFELSFCATSTTIVSGAVAERIRVNAYVLYSLLMAVLVYPIVSHWVWCEFGWLNPASPSRLFGVGVLDVAGGLVVHFTGGALQPVV
jgi:Amt family ammonium transporter